MPHFYDTSASYAVDTPIIALATPYGRSAIAAIRLSGTGSIRLFAKFFSGGERLTAAAKMVYGHITDENHNVLDEVMAVPFFAPRSYTGEEAVEIYGHGNMLLTESIIRLFLRNGFRHALPGEFTYRAFLHGKLDLTQAEAVHELIESAGEQAARAALTRLEGRLSLKINTLYQNSLTILAHLNAHLDYPDEETEALPLFNVDNDLAVLQQLVSSYNTSRLMQEGAVVVIAGIPNVGKSSLFNLLLNYDRAIVSPVAGATRDYIEAGFTLEGIPIRLTDTAGLRVTNDTLEQIGVDKSRKLLEEADIIIYLTDAANPVITEELANYHDKSIFVANKCDKSPPPEGYIAISVLKEEGINQLTTALLQKLNLADPQSRKEAALLGSARQQELCLEALKALENFKMLLNADGDISELAYYMKNMSRALAAVLGKNADKEAMDTMFSTFCLGK
jgi:tRNA modification GTPase